MKKLDVKRGDTRVVMCLVCLHGNVSGIDRGAVFKAFLEQSKHGRLALEACDVSFLVYLTFRGINLSILFTSM